jgi:hypothetical protein
MKVLLLFLLLNLMMALFSFESGKQHLFSNNNFTEGYFFLKLKPL